MTTFVPQPVLDITYVAAEFGFPGQTLISSKLYDLLRSVSPREEDLLNSVATLCGMVSRTPPASDNNHYIATRFNEQLYCIQAEVNPGGYNFNLVEGVNWEEVQAEEDPGELVLSHYIRTDPDPDGLPEQEYSLREYDALEEWEKDGCEPVYRYTEAEELDT